MPKRSGENLARTEDGTTYNKLQRPENWPLEPARRPSGNIEDGSDIDEACNGSLNEETSAQSIPKAKRGKQRLHNHKRKARNTENGCLPMDDDDFSSSDGNGVSFAAIQYLKGVRWVPPSIFLNHHC